MTDKNIETLRNTVERLSVLRLDVAASENDELDPAWEILLTASLELRELVEREGVSL
jgi:hypothetical protein